MSAWRAKADIASKTNGNYQNRMNRIVLAICGLTLTIVGSASYFFMNTNQVFPADVHKPLPSICLEQVDSINFIHWIPDWNGAERAPSKHDAIAIRKEIEMLQTQIWGGSKSYRKVTNVEELFPDVPNAFSVIVYEDKNAVLRSFTLLFDSEERSRKHSDLVFHEGNRPPNRGPRVSSIPLDVDRAVNPNARNSESAKFNRLASYVRTLKTMAKGKCTGPVVRHISNIPVSVRQRHGASE